MHRIVHLMSRFLFVGVLALTVVAHKSSAEKTPDRQEDLLPSNNLLSQAEMAKDIVNGRITPYNNPKLYFEIGVPKA